MADGYFGYKKLLYPGLTHGDCPRCGRSHRYTGKQFKCTKCGQKILIPQGDQGYKGLDLMIGNSTFYKHYGSVAEYNEDMREHYTKTRR